MKAPDLISLMGFPARLSRMSALVDFHASDGTSRSKLYERSNSTKLVSRLETNKNNNAGNCVHLKKKKMMTIFKTPNTYNKTKGC